MAFDYSHLACTHVLLPYKGKAKNNIDYMKEASVWLEETYPEGRKLWRKRFHVKLITINPYWFYFKDKDMAMHFRMVWG